MATIIRGPSDDVVMRLKASLDEYEQHFAGAEASLYRQNPGSIRVRVLDDRFAGMSRSRRHDDVWKFLSDRVGDDVVSEVALLLALPRAELRSSLSNLEFEDPVTSDT